MRCKMEAAKEDTGEWGKIGGEWVGVEGLRKRSENSCFYTDEMVEPKCRPRWRSC